MKGKFLAGSNEKSVERNIYSDKSSLVLEWLLKKSKGQELTLRSVALETGVSLGLVQGVFENLILKGVLKVEGVRTSKKFIISNLKILLEDWLDQYSIVKKCKMRTYQSGFQDKEELIKALKKSNFNQKTALALHSAAEALGYRNTNLNTLELYVLDPLIRPQLEKKLLLEPQEKGYEVLLIEPYYKSLIINNLNQGVNVSPAILTFLDLYHFPLRGQEQAEFILKRLPELKKIYTKR